ACSRRGVLATSLVLAALLLFPGLVRADTPARRFADPPSQWFSNPPPPSRWFTNPPASRWFSAPPASRWFTRGQVSAREPSAYDGLIQEIAARHGVEPALVKAMIQAESDFDRLALSPKGAAGLMQLLPATAASVGVRN